MLRPLYRRLRSGVLHDLIPLSAKKIFEGDRKAVEVVGFFQSATGIGESARLCARQLRSSGYKVRCVSVEGIFRKPVEMPWDFADDANEGEVGCRIIHLNPPMIPPYALKVGRRAFGAVYNIGYWAWELEEVPAEWKKAMRYVNAILCPSDFTSATIRKYTDKPVITVPHPVTIDTDVPTIRQSIGVSDGAFLVSGIFSFGSALERKNPFGSIQAFIQAFGHDEKAFLALKSNHGGHSEEKARLMALIAPYKNIRLIDEVWNREQVLGLIKSSDVFISLHRSEGFGLPIAEAMLMGTPVVVTDWSGSRDFCHADNSYPVGYKMIAVNSNHPEFKNMTSIVWADADVGKAAAILVEIARNPGQARTMLSAAMPPLKAYFSAPKYKLAVETLRTD